MASKFTTKSFALELGTLSCSKYKMLQLKNQFEHVIRSQRTLDWICSVEDLIEVLKKRDELNDERLGEIAQILEYNVQSCISPSRINIPNGNSVSVVCTLPVNNPTVLTNNLLLCSNPSLQATTSLQQNQIDGLQKVYRVICEDMGQSWRQFARELKCKEALIEDFARIGRVSEITRQILVHHENNVDPNCWRRKLLSALDEARRSDLRIKVEELLDRFSIIRLK